MKIPSENTIVNSQELGSGIFVGMNFMDSLTVFEDDYEIFLKNGGKKDIFAFTKWKMNMLRAMEDGEKARQYGLICLMLHEQELIKTYKRMNSHLSIGDDRKKYILSYIFSGMKIREIESLCVMGEHREIIEKLFTYWNKEFTKLLSSLQQTAGKNISSISDGTEEIYRILDGN